jgi:hypothetical protein
MRCIDGGLWYLFTGGVDVYLPRDGSRTLVVEARKEPQLHAWWRNIRGMWALLGGAARLLRLACHWEGRGARQRLVLAPLSGCRPRSLGPHTCPLQQTRSNRRQQRGKPARPVPLCPPFMLVDWRRVCGQREKPARAAALPV